MRQKFFETWSTAMTDFIREQGEKAARERPRAAALRAELRQLQREHIKSRSRVDRIRDAGR